MQSRGQLCWEVTATKITPISLQSCPHTPWDARRQTADRAILRWESVLPSDEAEAVQNQQRPKGVRSRAQAEFWPDISSVDHSPRDEAECDTHEKPNHLLWHDVSSSFQNSSLWLWLVAMIGALLLPGIAGLVMSAI